MSTYVSDTFTGTDGTAIASHTPDVGGAWSGSGVTLLSNQVVSGAFAGSFSLLNATLTSTADYEVSIDVHFAGTTPSTGAAQGSDVMGAHARDDGSFDYYEASYDSSLKSWGLWKVLSGTYTRLGSAFAMTYTQTQTHTVKLRVQGTTITMFVDGTSQVSVTDASISAKGKVGFVCFDNDGSLCLQGDNFLAADISAGGPTTAQELPIFDQQAASSELVGLTYQ
jgi:hypothetical protein